MSVSGTVVTYFSNPAVYERYLETAEQTNERILAFLHEHASSSAQVIQDYLDLHPETKLLIEPVPPL